MIEKLEISLLLDRYDLYHQALDDREYIKGWRRQYASALKQTCWRWPDQTDQEQYVRRRAFFESLRTGDLREAVHYRQPLAIPAPSWLETDTQQAIFRGLIMANELRTWGEAVRKMIEIKRHVSTGRADARIVLEKLADLRHGVADDCACPLTVRQSPGDEPERWWHDHHLELNAYLRWLMGRHNLRENLLRRLGETPARPRSDEAPLFSRATAGDRDRHLRWFLTSVTPSHRATG